MSDAVEHVHDVHEVVESDAITPGHDPRTETPAFRHARQQLIIALDKPCIICGVRNSTLAEARQTRPGLTLQSHHSPIERSFVEACDWRKVHLDFPQVVSQETLEAFVDSAANQMILCADHHIAVELGIHHLPHPTWIAGRYLLPGYELVPRKGEALPDVIKRDQQIEDAARQEESPTQPLAPNQELAHELGLDQVTPLTPPS